MSVLIIESIINTLTEYFKNNNHILNTNDTNESIQNGRVIIDYEYIRDTLPVTSLVWSSCHAQANLNINTKISLGGNPHREGFITTDSIDGKISHKYGLQWKRC